MQRDDHKLVYIFFPDSPGAELSSVYSGTFAIQLCLAMLEVKISKSSLTRVLGWVEEDLANSFPRVLLLPSVLLNSLQDPLQEKSLSNSA